ncbi:hypothetical protein [Sutcliffiella deserti]|uniref:hypothetical protein n=1 Tax=Sutcliffiella deserti TaxID=2875501 RepID=UPI001CBD8A1D|nr:hypothetical protein [Sutcliffiella deserti]
MKNNKEVVYFNAEGQMVDRIDVEQQTCSGTIEFCASTIVPDGFTFEFSGFDSLSVCVDESDLSCATRIEEVMGTAPNPCGGTITCQFNIEAIRILGTVRLFINIGDLIPNTPGFRFGPPCKLGLGQDVSVNQVLGYMCPQGCIDDCVDTAGIGVFRPTVTIDDCGRQVVTLRGTLFLTFLGCQ